MALFIYRSILLSAKSLQHRQQKKIGFTVKERKASYGKGKTKKQATKKNQ